MRIEPEDIKYARIRYVTVDILSMALAFFMFNICRYHILNAMYLDTEHLWNWLGSLKMVLEQIFVPICLAGVCALSGFYNKPFYKSRLEVSFNTFVTSAVNCAMIFLLMLLNDAQGKDAYYLMLLVMEFLMFSCMLAGRMIVSAYYDGRARRQHATLDVLMIGNSVKSRMMARRMEESRTKIPVRIIGYVRLPWEESVEDEESIWDIEETPDVCEVYKPEQMVIAMSVRDDRRVMKILDKLFPLNIPLKILPDTLSYLTSGIKIEDLMATPMIDLTSSSMNEFQKNVKRVSDVFVSVVAMLVLSPLYAALSIAVKRSSPGPVIYRQERIGKRQAPFHIYKFRSMRADAEQNGPQLTLDNDERMTPVGRFMRKYRLDELPQFWNVLAGEMSIVGPRPEREYYIRQIIERAPYYSLTFSVRPGITSLGMVKFGYASSVEQMVERSKYDLVYLNNMSLLTDMRIMAYTVRTIFRGEGK